MGDLEYIEGKVIAGDYFQVSGNINALNDTIEFVPANGKTAFLIEAKITMSTNPSAAFRTTAGSTTSNDQIVADLIIDTTVMDKISIGVVSAVGHRDFTGNGGNGTGGNGSGFSKGNNQKFNVLGLSLVGDGAKKIEIENVLDNGSAFATMSGYVVDT